MEQNTQFTHAALLEALAKADKVRMLHALRALLTSKAAEMGEDELRAMLHDLAHHEDVGVEVVMRAISGEQA
jgi:hypothetical protein